MFEYNIGNQVKVNTQPFQVNQKPDLRAAKAIESVNKMVQAGAKAYNTYQQEKDTTSFYEASKEAREVQSWYDNTISSTNDAYEKEAILNQYKIAMDSISQGYELEDKYREAYANAYDSFLSSQQRAIGAAVTQRKISDTTKVINDISLSLVNGDAELSIPIIKESIKELSTLVDTDEAESSVINMFIGNRINNIIKDKDKILEKDIKQVKSDLATFIKKAAPKLTGKELDVKLNTTLQTLIKAQKETATAKINNLLISEATTQKMFEKELDKYPHIFEKIEIANFKEKKANNVYNLKIANQTRSEAATKELNEVFLATHKALIDNPTATREEIIASYDEALKRKIYKSPEEMKNRLEKTLFDLETKKSSKDNKEAEAKAKIAKGVIDDLKTQSSYKGGMDPKEVQNYIGIKNKGNPFTKEDINWLNDYTGQYNMENNLEFANNIVKNTSTMYIGTPLEKGIKKGLTNIVNSSYTPQDFSASNILTIFNNHNIKGDIPTLITNDMNKIDTVPMALSRFEELKSYNKDLTKKLLGDKKYNLFKAMGTRLTVKDGNPYIAPDDYRKVMDIYNNPDKYPVDLTDFNEALKDDPNLFDKVEEYKTKVRFGTDTDDAVEEIQNEVSNTIPTEGVDLRGYSYNLTEDDTNILEDVVEYIKEVNPDFVGISYNPQDKLFYYSSKYDKYAAPVVTTSFDEEGNRQETSYSKFEGVDGMLFNVKNNMTKYYKENPKFLDQIINSYERKGKSLYYLYKDNIVPPVQEYIVDPLKRADEYIHNLSKDIKQWETETYDDIQQWKKDLYDRTFGDKGGLRADEVSPDNYNNDWISRKVSNDVADTFTATSFGKQLDVLKAGETTPIDGKEDKRVLSDLQKATKGNKEEINMDDLQNYLDKAGTEGSFKNMLKIQENSRKAGYDSTTDLWTPHDSPEGGLPTLGYGHKLTEAEAKSGKIIIDGAKYSYKDGLSTNVINKLFAQDIKKAQQKVQKTIGKDIWDKLSEKRQLLATELIFNIGSLSKFPTFTRLLKDLNSSDEELLKEINRGFRNKEGKFIPLTNRVNAIKDWYNA